MYQWRIKECTPTYLHFVGRVDGSSLRGFCPPFEDIMLLLDTLPPADTDETRSGLSSGSVGAGPMIKLSGADLVDVKGNLEPGDKVLAVVMTVSFSAPAVSVTLEKLLNQLSWLSTMSVREPDDSDSGASVWPAVLYISPYHKVYQHAATV